MTWSPRDNELRQRLHRSADPIDSPVAVEELVGLGRAALRRRRLGGVLAAALSVVVLATGVGGAVALLGGTADRPDVTGVATGPSDVPPSDVPPSDVPPSDVAPAPTPTTPSCTASSSGPGAGPSHRYDPTLARYRAVLATHLDPDARHLGEVSNVQSSDDGCATVYGLGTKISWSTAGVSGLGVVQIEVNRGLRYSQIHLAHGGWRQVTDVPAGVARALVAEYEGGRAVAVTRPDGITVAIDVDSLFANNSTVPTTAMDFTTSQLLRAAADPDLQLP